MQAAVPTPFGNRPMKVKSSETRHAFPSGVAKIANASLLTIAFMLTASCTDTASSSTTIEPKETRSSLAKPSEFVERWNNCAKHLPTFQTIDKVKYSDVGIKKDIPLSELDNYINPHGGMYFLNNQSKNSISEYEDAIALYYGNYEMERQISNISINAQDIRCFFQSTTFDLTKDEIEKIISSLTSRNHAIETLDYKNKSFWIQINQNTGKYRFRITKE